MIINQGWPACYADWKLRGQVGDWVLITFTLHNGRETYSMMHEETMKGLAAVVPMRVQPNA